MDKFRKIMDWLEYIVTIITLLEFIKKLYCIFKRTILSTKTKFKAPVYKIKKYIIYKKRKIKNILYEIFLSIIKLSNEMIDCFGISRIHLSRKICFFLLFIIIFNLNPLICKDENDYLNRNTVNSKMEYVSSDNVNNQLNEIIINENNLKSEKLFD